MELIQPQAVLSRRDEVIAEPEGGTKVRLANALVLTDFSPSSELALPCAVALAGQYNGKVIVTHVISPEMYEYAPPELALTMQGEIERYGNRRMQMLLSQAEFHNVPHEAVVCKGEIWDTLKQLVENFDIDVIVIGTHGRRGLKKTLMGAVAEEVLRLARISVLTVGPECRGAFPHYRPSRILYPTDFSEDSVQAMAHAVSLAESFGASLLAMYVTSKASEDPSTKTRFEEFFEERLQELLSGEASSVRRLEYRVKFGMPSDGILQVAAEEKVDLIVMGLRGAGSLHRSSHRLGTTADEVVSGACCPVLTVRRLG
jgi:nucleotide-binding universal stress UspA family protein